MKTIYYNANIITMDEKTLADSICIKEERIMKVGCYDEVMKLYETGDQLIDLNGKTMLPAFIDAHSHFFGLANSLMQCDLSKARNFDEIISLMKLFIKNNQISDGEMVVGCGYDHNFLDEKKHPDKYVLDQISTRHEILITHISSHMGVANSLALENHQITADTRDVAGGKYGRIAGSNEVNGYMEENAFIQFQNQNADLKQLFSKVEQAQNIYASYGIATIQEGMVSKELFQLLKYASEQGLLKLDVVAYLDLANCRSLMKQYQEYAQFNHHLKIGGYKIFLDGSPQGRTAWMLEPYEKSQESGYPTLTDDQLNHLIQMAVEDGQQLLAHCNGDAAAEQYLTQFEKVMANYPDKSTHRPVMIHAQLVRQKQLSRMVQLNMIPSFFVAHTYYWGDIHIENFGIKRAAKISPANSAKKLNLPFTFHQDTPVLPPDMWKTIWCATNRQTKKGIVLGKEECISVMDALRAVTINAAYQYHDEAIKGSLTEGKLADFIIVDQNPLAVDVTQLDKIKVLETYKEGKCIYIL